MLKQGRSATFSPRPTLWTRSISPSCAFRKGVSLSGCSSAENSPEMTPSRPKAVSIAPSLAGVMSSTNIVNSGGTMCWSSFVLMRRSASLYSFAPSDDSLAANVSWRRYLFSSISRSTSASLRFVSRQALCAFSNARSGSATCSVTAVLREPGGRMQRAQSGSSSKYPGRTRTRTTRWTEIASAPRASIPARSGGVAVDLETASTNSRSQGGKTSTGNDGRDSVPGTRGRTSGQGSSEVTGGTAACLVSSASIETSSGRSKRGSNFAPGRSLVGVFVAIIFGLGDGRGALGLTTPLPPRAGVNVQWRIARSGLV